MRHGNIFIAAFNRPARPASVKMTSGGGYAGSTFSAFIPGSEPGSWYADDVAIPGETNYTFTMTTEHEGKAISFKSASYDLPALSRLYVPSQTAGLIAWFDASNTSALTLTGNSVSRWNSRVGSLYLFQDTGTAQPTYSATGRNNLPAVIANGTSHFMQFNNIGALPTGTNPSHVMLAAFYEPVSATWRGLIHWGGLSGAGRFIAKASGNYAAITGGSSATDNLSNVTWTGSDRIYSGLITGTQSVLHIDGATTGFTKTATYNTSGTSNGYVFRSTTNQWWYGSAQDIMIFDRNITTDRQKIEGYLAAKWNLRGLLPSGHPYKSVAPPSA